MELQKWEDRKGQENIERNNGWKSSTYTKLSELQAGQTQHWGTLSSCCNPMIKKKKILKAAGEKNAYVEKKDKKS